MADYPSDPSIGLLNGKFHDGDPQNNIPGSVIPSEWANALTDEIIQVIEDGGLVPDENDLTQLSTAISALIAANAISPAGGDLSGPLGFHIGDNLPSQATLAVDDDNNGQFYTVTGTTNISALAAGFKSPLILKFADQLSLVHSANLILPGSLDIVTAANDIGVFWQTAANVWQCILYQRSSGQSVIPTPPVDQRHWPTVASDADTDHDILISPGSIADSTGVKVLTVGADLVKRIDAAWAAGSGSGGMFTGAVGANSTYHLFLIRNDTDGSIDAGFDTSLSAVNRPAGYTRFRRIASFHVDSSANIRPFFQRGRHFVMKTPVNDINAAFPGASPGTLYNVPVPNGLALMAQFIYNSSSNSDALLSSPDQTDLDPATFSNIGQNETGHLEVATNTSGQVRGRRNAGSGNIAVSLWSYFDPASA